MVRKSIALLLIALVWPFSAARAQTVQSATHANASLPDSVRIPDGGRRSTVGGALLTIVDPGVGDASERVEAQAPTRLTNDAARGLRAAPQSSVSSTGVGTPRVAAAPNANAGGPYAIAEGDSLQLDASASFDVDLDPLIFEWDLNDDGVFDNAIGVTPLLSWSDLQGAGIVDDSTYALAVRVFDGALADTASTLLTVANTPPTIALAGSSSVDAGTPFNLTLSAQDPGNDTILF